MPAGPTLSVPAAISEQGHFDFHGAPQAQGGFWRMAADSGRLARFWRFAPCPAFCRREFHQTNRVALEHARVSGKARDIGVNHHRDAKSERALPNSHRESRLAEPDYLCAGQQNPRRQKGDSNPSLRVCILQILCRKLPCNLRLRNGTGNCEAEQARLQRLSQADDQGDPAFENTKIAVVLKLFNN